MWQSNQLSELYFRKKSFLNIPANMTPGYSFKSSNQRTITQSINDPNDFFLEHSPVAQPANVLTSSSARWIYDSIEGAVKRMGLMESLLSFDPIKQDAQMKQIRSRLVSSIEMKSSDLSRFHRNYRQLSKNTESVAKSLRSQGSETKFSQELIFSCPSTKSTSSYLSTSSALGFVNSALLYCVWESNVPYFLFFTDDDGGREVYLASPLKARPSVDKSLDYIYLFHSYKGGRKESKKNVAGASYAVGKMKVSSSLIVNLNGSKFMETEFVLFGANEEHSTGKEKPLSNRKQNNSLSTKMAEFLRPSHSFKHNSKHKVCESGSELEDVQQFLPGELLIIDEPFYQEHLVNDFPPSLELAAVVVRDYGYNISKGSAFGGWGLKFLDKVELDDADCSQDLSSSSPESCEERYRIDRKKTARNVTVLIPAGFHGGPITGAGGPSSLTERWKSNGRCDCGGWDAGCPIQVLNSDSICSEILPKAKMEEHCNSFELFIEGGKHSEPALEVFSVGKETYIVKSQSTLSALQSFSIGVAFIHSQTPDLYPKLLT